MTALQQGSRRLPRRALGLLLLGYFVAGLLTLADGHAWGDDWAQYVLHARNIVAGRPYADTGYLFNPDAPSTGPAAYPPGLPLLLAPVLSVFGMDIGAFKVLCFLGLVASLPIAWRLLSRTFGEGPALVAVVLFALHDRVWAWRDGISSESPYLLFSLLALWLAARGAAPNATPSGAGIGSGLVLGSLVYAAFASRSIGMALVPALLVHGWARRRRLPWFAAFLASFGALVWLQKTLLVLPPTYSSELKSPTVSSVLQNASAYLVSLGTIFRMPGGLSTAAAAAVLLLALVGFAGVVAAPAAAASGRGLRALAARVPPEAWYLAAYLAALLVATVPQNARYFNPVLVLLVAFALRGGAALLSRLPRPRRLALPAAAALALYYAVLHATTPRPRPDEYATCPEAMQLYEFVRENTRPGAVIGFAKPRAMALFAGRPSWVWSPKYSPAELRRRLEETRTSLLVVAAPDSALGFKYPAALDFPAAAAAPGAVEVFRNRMFAVTRLGPADVAAAGSAPPAGP